MLVKRIVYHVVELNFVYLESRVVVTGAVGRSLDILYDIIYVVFGILFIRNSREVD